MTQLFNEFNTKIEYLKFINRAIKKLSIYYIYSSFLEFNNNKQDLELKYLAEYLSLAAEYDDLREFNKKQLKLHELSEMKIEDLEI